MKLRNSLAKHT